eukprot:1161089-Pelagomonas_calceolata.AAC.2
MHAAFRPAWDRAHRDSIRAALVLGRGPITIRLVLKFYAHSVQYAYKLASTRRALEKTPLNSRHQDQARAIAGNPPNLLLVTLLINKDCSEATCNKGKPQSIAAHRHCKGLDILVHLGSQPQLIATCAPLCSPMGSHGMNAIQLHWQLQGSLSGNGLR